jgi:hypothetical protein
MEKRYALPTKYSGEQVVQGRGVLSRYSEYRARCL